MATVTSASTVDVRTLADLIHDLGDIPLERIRLRPSPGTATKRDVTRIQDREGRLFELVDGVLVEKAVGFYESCLAVVIAQLLRNFVAPKKLGVVAGADGTIELTTGLVRIPDVAFFSWKRLPGRAIPAAPIPRLAPDLAVEVLSESNTAKEMERKLRDYFAVGVLLVWIVDPPTRTVQVYSDAKQFVELRENDWLDGGAVLPGFRIRVKEIFDGAGPQAGKPRERRAKNKNGEE